MKKISTKVSKKIFLHFLIFSTIGAVAQAPCLEVIGGQTAYSYEIWKNYPTTPPNPTFQQDFRTITTYAFGGQIYSVHQNLTPDPHSNALVNRMFISLHDEISGAFVKAHEFWISNVTGEEYLGEFYYPKEIKVLLDENGDEMIYLIGNTSRPIPDRDNSRFDEEISGMLTKIDPSDMSIKWSQYERRLAVQSPGDPLPDNIFYNSFSAVHDNHGNFAGFVIVGAARFVFDAASPHTRLEPVLLRSDPAGNIAPNGKVHLSIDIPCTTCFNDDFESNWAIDISDQVDHPEFKFAVLLESRDYFNGWVGFGPLNSSRSISYTYLLIDENLFAHQISSAGGAGPLLTTMPWFRTEDETNYEKNARKIWLGYNSSNNLSVKIVGQTMDFNKGFIHGFEPHYANLYASVAQREIDVKRGFVDLTVVGDETFVTGRIQTYKFDAALNLIDASDRYRITSTLFHVNDFNWSNNYIGGLIRPHTQHGFIINDTREQKIIKTTDDLDMTCYFNRGLPDSENGNSESYEFTFSMPALVTLNGSRGFDGDGRVFENPCCTLNSPDPVWLMQGLDPDGFDEAYEGESSYLEFIVEENETDEVSLDNSFSKNFNLVPNPSSSTFQISNDRTTAIYDKVTIVDLQGKIVFSETNVSAQKMYDLSASEDGTYFVEIITNETLIRKRLVLVK